MPGSTSLWCRIDRIGTKALLRALPRRPAGLLVGVSTMLAQHRGRFVTARELAEWVYADDPAGGALTADDCIWNAVHRLRAMGVPIETWLGGTGNNLLAYRMTP